MPNTPHILIIGGGISGLSAAWELQQQAGERVRLTVLEADGRLGGKVLTQTMPAPNGGQFIVDAGPESFVTRKPAAWQLTRELGLEALAMNPGNEAAGTYVLDDGRLRPLPLSPGAFIKSDLLTWRGKLRMLAEPFIPPKRDGADESLADFVTRRLGREALEKFIGPVLGGIYNSDPETQSILVTSPIMRELEAHGSLVRGSIRHMRARRRAAQSPAAPPFRFLGFTPGAEVLITALTAQLQADLRLNAVVVGLERTAEGTAVLHLAGGESLTADAVIITTPANVAAKLVTAVAPEAATQLAQIRHAHIGTISLAYPAEAVAHTAPIRGLMIPRREKRRIDAVTWTSAKVPGRAPEGYALLRVFIGGGLPATVTMPESDLLPIVQEELADLLQIKTEPLDYRLARWPDSYPQADVGHLARVAAIERLLPAPFYVTGSAYRGLAVPDCIQQAREMAGRVMTAVCD
ncbi:MAG: protoporphyrinogen oxidase [Anaerolinea sp.]|nr:protoporphyrinogen oxidase [Anaerolinea sp.]